MTASAVVALERVGFCRDEAKPFGPVQAYVAPATVGVESAIVAPAQYGPPFDAVGVAGGGLTTTVFVPAAGRPTPTGCGIDYDRCRAGGGRATADGDGHRVDARIGGRRAGARRVL